MKYTVLDLCKRQIVPLGVLAVSCLFIWFDGSFISIAGSAPLQDTTKRLQLMAFFCLLWLVKAVCFDRWGEKADALSITPELKKKLQQLQGRFHGAVQFLKNTIIEKQGKNIRLNQLPWYLAIGPAGVGKTTLLVNSKVNFILAKPFKAEGAAETAPSQTCHWWVTRDMVLVDVPGAYFSHRFNFLWRHLLQLLAHSRNKNKLEGAVLFLDLPQLMQYRQGKKKNEMIADLKPRIADLLQEFSPSLPLHLVITQCDLLPGFVEFFGEMTPDEIAQPCGIVLPPRNARENLPMVFAQRFNALIRRLNKQLIWRLHHERDHEARPSIKDFPWHLEQLKEAVVQLLKSLGMPDLLLSSVHLTSGTQSKVQEETSSLFSADGRLDMPISRLEASPGMPSRAYFIRQFILQHLPNAPRRTSFEPKVHYWWRQRLVYASSVGTIIAAAILLGRDFQYGVQQAYSVQDDLSQYQLSLKKSDQRFDHLREALPLLNALRQAADASPGKLSLAFYSNKAKKTANTVYHQALQTIVLPEIQHYFEAYLQTAGDKNPEETYDILKAWLMLGDKEHFQGEFIADMLQRFISNSESHTVIKALMDHVRTALMTASTAAQLDEALIAQTRARLLELPKPALAFLILKNMDSNEMAHPLNLGIAAGGTSVFTSKAVDMLVPVLFTAQGFDRVMTHDVHIAATEALQGNWILGSAPSAPEPAAIDKLTGELSAQYVANYVDIWESLLTNIQLKVPKNLTQLNQMIMTLTGDHSPLLQLLSTLKENTALAPVIAVSPKLRELSVVLAEVNTNQSGTLYAVFVGLQELQAALQKMLTGDEGANAFQMTVQRMQAPEQGAIARAHAIAERSPDPLKTWLHTMASESWRFMLQETGAYVQNNWGKNIVPAYHAAVDHYYPFDPSAKEMASSQTFADFFGYQGLLANFYETYLKYFLEDSQGKLLWRTVDHQKIVFSDELLDRLTQAARLRQMCFLSGTNKLNSMGLKYFSSRQPTNVSLSSLNITGFQLPEQLFS
jgi:type VI secretion system protein ImpL